MSKPDYYNRTETISTQRWRKKAVVSFIIFIALLIGAYFFWQWLNHQPQQGQALQPLRKGYEFNEKVFHSTLGKNAKAKEFTVADAVKNVRVNGNIGMLHEVDTATWRLAVVKAPGDTLRLSLDDIKKLPKRDVIFDFKCIEGWSQITHWAGVPLFTFLEHYHLQFDETKSYLGLETIDKQYYVGIDMKSALLPQTILCYEMNGKPLPMNQGYPLRLIIPSKYGIKHLKQIGTMFFSDAKPRDYWAERGYDYYSGL